MSTPPPSRPTLGPARPEMEDGLVFARHLDTAADGVFRTMIGARFEEVIAAAYLSPGHDLSYERVTFAEHEGRIVGTASGYSAGQHRESDDRPLTKAAGVLTLIRLAAVYLPLRPVLHFIDQLPDGDFYLQAIAVDDDQRGNGVGSMLMDHVDDIARSLGCRRIALDVADDNPDARRLYERRDMVVEASSRPAWFGLAPCVHRMVREL